MDELDREEVMCCKGEHQWTGWYLNLLGTECRICIRHGCQESQERKKGVNQWKP